MNEDFYALNGNEGIQFEFNYHEFNSSPNVSLRMRKFDKKIRYCCRDSEFFVEKDI